MRFLGAAARLYNLNFRDERQSTIIARLGNLNLIDWLLNALQEGADPLLKDEEGHNCLHWAVFHRHHLVVQWLLQQAALRAYVDEADTVGQTALHLGARKSGREMCRRLLDAGASPAAVDAKGLTAEAAAAKEGRRSNAGYLRWHARLPRWLGRLTVARGAGGRTYVTCPTPHGGIAAGCILLAYLYYAAVLLPGTWGQQSTAHWLLAIATVPMVGCFVMAWKGDPGLIPAQPAAVIAGLVSGELGMEDLIVPAVSPKYPRAKYSRMFNCYVARRGRRRGPRALFVPIPVSFSRRACATMAKNGQF
jgi:hypothetical protein